MAPFEPIYLETKRKGLLRDKINEARNRLKSCVLCPRECDVDRLAGELGECNTAEEAMVSSFNAHFGEEPPLVGAFGSGTIFFTYCNLKCNFCQNYDISHEGIGDEYALGQLATTMLVLQNYGCHNINFVTPSHVVPQILAALDMAIDGGLKIPLVYNSGGYDKVETLQLLDGIVGRKALQIEYCRQNQLIRRIKTKKQRQKLDAQLRQHSGKMGFREKRGKIFLK